MTGEAPLAPVGRGAGGGPWSARRLLAALGPGILVAATGVGAGDLATGAFAGIQVGPALLWAVVVGAGLKFVLNEGLARWQLVTGETLLEGGVRRLGWPVKLLFPLYLLPWTYFVGAALMSACGVTAHALVPVFEDPARGKLVFGIASSVVGTVLVLRGGYKLFERMMAACIGLMFVTVLVTAVALRPDVGPILRGLFLPSIPSAGGEGLGWTVALIGGVGGTLTVLCYGYWIREEKRVDVTALRACRIDLGVGYLMTALFGLAMVTIGSQVDIDVERKGALLIVAIADRLADPLGAAGRWAFLVGAFGAVFSSLFGVWQAVPYVFADFLGLLGGRAAGAEVDTRGGAYRVYLFGIATVPALGLFANFAQVQKLYAIVGACFLPILAVALLVLNGRRGWVGEHRNRPATVLVLLATLVFFAYAAWS